MLPLAHPPPPHDHQGDSVLSQPVQLDIHNSNLEIQAMVGGERGMLQSLDDRGIGILQLGVLAHQDNRHLFQKAVISEIKTP